MKQYLDKYLENQININGKKPNTVKMMKLVLTDFFNDTDVISIESIESWISSKSMQKTTKKQYVGLLRGYIDWCIDKDYYIGKNPAKIVLSGMGKASDYKPDKRNVFTLTEVKEMIRKTLNPRDRAILLTLAKSGGRANEVCSILLNNVNFTDNTIKLTNRKGDQKGSKDTLLPMDNELAQSLKMWIQIRGDVKDEYLFTSYLKKKISPISIWYIVKEAAERIGIKDGHPHCLRHFFTSILNQNRCHPEVIAILRGDAKKGTVRYYTHLDFNIVREEYFRAMPKIILKVYE